jgi:hypothetical protein
VRLSINQPAYLPWLGYFDRIARSDAHVVLDLVQFEKNSMVNRNKIRTSSGWSWLTVPVKTKNKFGDLSISRLEVDVTSNWREKHWKAICQNYSKTRGFKCYSPMLEEIYTSEWTHLFALTEVLNNFFLKTVFQISTPLFYESKLQVNGKKSDLVLDICRKLGATTYISGPFGRDYLEVGEFAMADIGIEYHDYQHPIYSQQYQPFEPYLSVLDLIMNCGPDSKEVFTR